MRLLKLRSSVGRYTEHWWHQHNGGSLKGLNLAFQDDAGLGQQSRSLIREEFPEAVEASIAHTEHNARSPVPVKNLYISGPILKSLQDYKNPKYTEHTLISSRLLIHTEIPGPKPQDYLGSNYPIYGEIVIGYSRYSARLLASCSV